MARNGKSSIQILALLLALVAAPAAVRAAQPAPAPFDPSPQAIDIPRWFKETFLDFREDIAEAAAAGKRLMVYFGQDGCPYCKRLMQVNFGQRDIADKTRQHFNALAINMWGDREVTWIDGKSRSEKNFAAELRVQFTPTLLFFDEKGKIVLRVNGYYPPHKFRVALDYVSGHNEEKMSFADYLRQHGGKAGGGDLNDQPFLLKPPLDLAAHVRGSGRFLAVLFEQKHCAACDELHQQGFADPAVREFIGKLDFARVELFGSDKLVTPEGRNLTAAQWGRQLGLAYTPSIVFFDAAGREAFRIETYLRPFHLASSFDYVTSKAYLVQPSFQRFLQARAEQIRRAGGRVELW
ncbi:MAG: thioredoxin fold domain-containing protein [Betaproteobacteria bacterium]|nr:MAG: thioredoxin fold domain-containing protein [Betaproteobacteria bacterium]